MSIKVNGKKTTVKKAQEIIDDENTVIESLSIELPNKKKKKGPTTMEGFDLDKEFILELASGLETYNAKYITSKFTNCGKLGGHHIFITVIDKDCLEEYKEKIGDKDE